MIISPDQERRLRELVAAFLAENQKINLSAYREEEQCWVGNILDSIEGIGGNEFGEGMRVLDLGTGGGFPLLPLAILFPNVSFTGLDATKKKIEAVRRIANHLNLTNVDLLIGRAEELGREVHLREQFDAVLSRAVASLATLLEFMSPFVRVGGRIFCYKSLTIEEEVLQSIQARMQLKTRLTDRRIYSLDEAVERGGLPTVAQPEADIARLRATRYGGQPPLRGGWGWSIFGAVWGAALLGIIWKLAGWNMSKWLSGVAYLLMGWVVVIAVVPLLHAISLPAFWWLLSGGVCYSAGVIFFGLETVVRPRRWFGMHEIFHLLVMAGSACHWWTMYHYVAFY